MKRYVFLLIIYIIAGTFVSARGEYMQNVVVKDSLYIEKDTINHTQDSKKSWFNRKVSPVVSSFVKFFSPEYDSLYIESQKYNFTVMAQTVITDDHFFLESEDTEGGMSYSIDMAPKASLRFGPFFGWRWIFYGYTFNLNTLNLNNDGWDIDMSIYTPSLGIDLVYRNLGDAYRLRSMKVDDLDATKQVKGMPIHGLDIDIIGLKAFYILNPKKYSHQALFNQTNRQIKSAGSWLLGTGWYRNSISMDWDKFNAELQNNSNISISKDFNDSTLFFKKIVYSSVPITLGYGYNWVLPKNWVAGVQFLGSASYMWTHSDAEETSFSLKSMIDEMSFSNFTFDGALRIGFVWNNSKWFAGANAIYHSYNYRNKNTKASNIFGTGNIYFGFNFWKRKK